MANAYFRSLLGNDSDDLTMMQKCVVCLDMKNATDMFTICESYMFHVSCSACTRDLALHRAEECPLCRGVIEFENADELPSIEMEGEEGEAGAIEDLMSGVREDHPGQFEAWRRAEQRNEGLAMRFLSPAPSSIRESVSRSPEPSTFSPLPYNTQSPSFQPRIPLSVERIKISLQQNVNACHIFHTEDGDFEIYTPLTCPLCNA